MLAVRPRLLLPSSLIREINSEAELVSQLQRGKRLVEDVAFLNPRQTTLSLRELKIGNLVISENISDPITFKTSIDLHLSFLVPFSGSAKAIEAGRSTDFPSSSHIIQRNFSRRMELELRRFHHVAFLPLFSDLASAVSRRRCNAEEIMQKALTGRNGISTGRFGGLDYCDQLISLLGVVNSTNGDAEFLARIGFDGVVVNTLAEYLVATATDTGEHPGTASKKRSDRAVDIICDHITSNVGRPLTIPCMEELTGMTGRAIAYAFQSRFNCSPQQWQRNFLLDEAHRQLASEESPRSIKAIAFEFGFSSASSFSSHYRRRFGRLPSRITTH